LVITPDISAETWLGAAGWASGSQTGLGACAQQGQGHHGGGGGSGRRMGADAGKVVDAPSSRHQAEGRQQAEGAEGGHDQIDGSGMAAFLALMVRQHQQPGGQGHELPGHQKNESVIGDQHAIHAEQEQREQRRDPVRLLQMRHIAAAIQSGQGGGDVNDHQEEGRQAVEPEMRRHPGQAEGQGDGGDLSLRRARQIGGAIGGQHHRHGGAGQMH